MPAPSHDHAPAPGEAARFDALVTEAGSVSVDGWDFSWLDGRATEQRPSWGYARAMGERMGRARAALDIQTGGGEVLASVPKLPPLAAATESWPPNIARATALLHPRGVVVVADEDEPPLPFADAAFDLVVSRHPVTTWWDEIARVLAPGGTYFSQQVGPGSVFELVEYFLGPQPPRRAAHATRSGPGPTRRRPDSTSPTCGSSGCAPSSSTSAPSSTSCARSSGWCPASPSSSTGPDWPSSTTGWRPRARSSRTPPAS